jgi:hypothetical protein
MNLIQVPSTPIGYVPVAHTGILHKYMCATRGEAWTKLGSCIGHSKEWLKERGYYVAPVYANIYPAELPQAFNVRICRTVE